MSVGPWIAAFDDGAVRDFEDVKNTGERKAVFNVTNKLHVLGPRLVPPHVKSLKGHPGLNELRPRQGSSAVRPIYAQVGDRYVVLAIAKDHGKDMDTAIAIANERLKAWHKSADV